MGQMSPDQRVNRNNRRVKLALGCAGLGSILLVGMLFAGLILTPLVFRNLSPDLQYRIINRLPFMKVFAPTQQPGASVLLPTISATSADALSLLNDPSLSGTKTLDGSILTPTFLPSASPSATTAASATNTSTPLILTAAPPTAASTATNTTVAIVQIPTTSLAPTSTPKQVIIVPNQLPKTSPTSLPSATSTSSPTSSPTTVPTTVVPVTATAISSQAQDIVAQAITNTPNVPPSATSTLTLTPSIVPSATLVPTVNLPPSLTFTPSLVALPQKVRLTGLTWEPQGWNNCGPANLVQVLRYFKWTGTQAQIANTLKPNKNDKNVSPWELVRYVNNVQKPQLKALTRSAGDIYLLKRLIAAKLGVITESGFYDPDNPDEGWIGHYLTITAYDDSTGELTRLDTFKNVHNDRYEVFDGLWQNFNRQYVVIYPPEREAEVAAILGPDMDVSYNAQHAFDVARKEAVSNRNDAFAWYNLGTSLDLLGKYKDAATAYDQAFSVDGGSLPYRIIWYQFGPFDAYYNAGRYNDVMRLVNANLGHTNDVEESFFWRGMVEAAKSQMQEATTDFNQALSLNPGFTPAKDALTKVQTGTFKVALSQ